MTEVAYIPYLLQVTVCIVKIMFSQLIAFHVEGTIGMNGVYVDCIVQAS